MSNLLYSGEGNPESLSSRRCLPSTCSMHLHCYSFAWETAFLAQIMISVYKCILDACTSDFIQQQLIQNIDDQLLALICQWESSDNVGAVEMAVRRDTSRQRHAKFIAIKTSLPRRTNWFAIGIKRLNSAKNSQECPQVRAHICLHRMKVAPDTLLYGASISWVVNRLKNISRSMFTSDVVQCCDLFCSLVFGPNLIVKSIRGV